MSAVYLTAAEKIVDGQGSMSDVEAQLQRLHSLGLTPHELRIEALGDDWHAPEQENSFRSGCGPIEALAQACSLIKSGTAAVIIRGEDLIKSGYSREQRHKLMAVYGEGYPLTQAYTDLAQQFIHNQKIDADQFQALAAALFENYKNTFVANAAEQSPEENTPLPDERWYKPITSLFRGVDCANPMIDFQGAVLLCNEETLHKLKLPESNQIKVSGVGLGRLTADGAEMISEIAEYNHLQQAFDQACQQAGFNFSDQFMQGNALLDVYTCYPVVPMAFLLKSGLVSEISRIPALLQEYPVTVTGGMNLARAPWNNPALNGLISVYQTLLSSDKPVGGVHGNGGLGYRQGFAILEKLRA